MTAGGPPVLIDLIAAQSPSYRDRGIARFGLGFTEAMLARRPDLVAGVVVRPDLARSRGMEWVDSCGKLVERVDGDAPGDILHLTSVFEPEVAVGRLWPAAASARRMPLVVTVYDLVPELFPEMYLVDPGLRRIWRTGRQVVMAADRVLTISRSVSEDVMRLLGVPERRVTCIGTGCDERWRPPADRGAAAEAARRALPGLTGPYAVYNGAMDPRKNVERLIEAFALLPERVRTSWQLVVACAATADQRHHLLVKAERLGVAGRVLVPGFVSDDLLVSLYQGADLSVFPSLYEGYGLPVVEALACGAPVICADNSSLREIMPADMRFDGYDTRAIAEAVRRALTDEGYRRRLMERTREPRPTWGAVADRAAAVYEDLAAVHRRAVRLWPGWRAAPRLAVVAPSPDAGEEEARHGRGLAEALAAAGASVDLYVPGATPGPDPGPGRAGLVGDPWRLLRVAPWRGGYDGVVLCVGDHESYAAAAALIGKLPHQVVVAYDAPLRRAYAAADRTGRLRPGLAARLEAMYPPAGDGTPEPLMARLAATLADAYFGVSAAVQEAAAADAPDATVRRLAPADGDGGAAALLAAVGVTAGCG